MVKVARVRQTATEHNFLYLTGHQEINRHPKDTYADFGVALRVADDLNSLRNDTSPWKHDAVVEDDPKVAYFRFGRPVEW